RVGPGIMRDAARLDERRDLEDAVSIEDVHVIDARADFEVGHNLIVIDEAAGTIASQSLLIREQALLPPETAHRPERSLVTSRDVLRIDMAGQDDALADPMIAADLGADLVVRAGTQETSIRAAVVA